MEDVFSSAYCVVAASSARGQRDGFLRGRKERQFLRLTGRSSGGGDGKDVRAEGGGGLYVCRFIENFTEHVLDSPLSKRGWVLQERALARRTIYFTDWQTYWECGEGVRCETMTKVDKWVPHLSSSPPLFSHAGTVTHTSSSKLASFLGDPNFPSKLSGKLVGTDRGERIRFYEDLFQTYSRLDFTRVTDRPIAISGLEQRMLRDLGSRGGFGIFDDGRSLLPRSLLWQRGHEVGSLKRFDHGTGLRLPSWSWMAYDGPIDFMDLPLGEVDWLEDEVRGPWAEGGATSAQDTIAAGGKGLTAVARPFTQEPVHDDEDDDSEIILDGDENTGTHEWRDWRCIVVGTRRVPRGGRMTPVEGRTHYFLIVAPVGEGSGDYTRIGVGRMAGFVIGERIPARIMVE